MTVAFLLLLPQLISAGIATAAEIKSLLATRQPGMTDAELNAVLDLIIASAAKHQATAHADQAPNA